MELGAEPEAPRRKRKRKRAAAEAAVPGPYDRTTALGLAGLSGLLYFGALPGIGVWPLAFVAQVPLALALRGQAPRRAALVGFASGMVMAATGFHWLVGTVARFGEVPAPLALVVALALWAQMAGRMAALGWLVARAEARGWPFPLPFGAAFAATELLYPLIFPWFFSVTVYEIPTLLQAAELGGPYVVSLVLLGPNLAIAELLWARREQRPPSRAVVAAGFAAIALAAGLGRARMAMVDARAAAAPAIRVGLAQGNQPPKGRKQSTATYRRLTDDLRDQRVDLVVWPEGAVADVYPEPTYGEDLRREVTGTLGVAAIFGGGLVREVAGVKRETNSAFLADASGAVLGRYDKQKLLPFGETLPFAETFPALRSLAPNTSELLRGTTMEPFVWQGHRIAPLICYEDILPSYVRAMVASAEPDLLVNLTIDTWFGRTTEPWSHAALAAFRAIEHRRFLVRATNSGVSAVVDPVGRFVATSGLFEEEKLVAEVRWLRGRTAYELVGDAPLGLVSVLAIAAAFVRRRRATSDPPSTGT